MKREDGFSGSSPGQAESGKSEKQACLDFRPNLSALYGVERIYLVGARGSGKTTVGRALAAMLGYGFCDLDSLLTQTEGKTIADIVAAQGWEDFRRLESRILREAAKSTRMVFSTGGGVILAPENRAFMTANGIVIWLRAAPDILATRLVRSPFPEQRPPLGAGSLEDEIRQTLATREPLYKACSRHIVDGSLDVELVCAAIATCLGLNE